MAELKDFLGKHTLTGCEYNRIELKDDYWNSEANTIDFIIDGKEYRCIEDPDDDYRSSMREIIELDSGTIKNTFCAQEVVGKMKDNDRWRENYTVQLIDTTTGLVVIEFGTDNYNDYYPEFVGSFYPQNMAINKNK